MQSLAGIVGKLMAACGVDGGISQGSGGVRNIRTRNVSSWGRSQPTTLPGTYIPVD
ncbi:hypothetical protein NE575_10390 [Clostridium sp. SL.3.18]|nr:hypothetical protein [Clostridium sp. SL.3.18]